MVGYSVYIVCTFRHAYERHSDLGGHRGRSDFNAYEAPADIWIHVGRGRGTELVAYTCEVQSARKLNPLEIRRT